MSRLSSGRRISNGRKETRFLRENGFLKVMKGGAGGHTEQASWILQLIAMKGILGKKIGMTQIFDERGEVIPVTIIEAGPCYVTQKKTAERDGYWAVQLGFDEVPERRLSRGQRGHLGLVPGKGKRQKQSTAEIPPLRYLREMRGEDTQSYEEGQKIDVSIFAVGDKVDVVGTSKGRGTAGVVKRHGFHGGPRTHGQSDRLRRAGAISAGTTPGRIYKGLRMAGRMGAVRVTVPNLEVVLVDPERNLLLVKGAVPGARNGLLIIKEARKAKRAEKSKG
jgi:large subunit ribosomal protein L3